MPWFKSKPERIHAEQLLGSPLPRGVKENRLGILYVTTIQGTIVQVHPGEWIVDEGDGEHFYSIADAVFKGSKGYDPE